MKLPSCVVILTSLAFVSSLLAQEQKARAAKMLTVATKWPGIDFSIYDVQRIQDNRLLVWVQVRATAKAPREGTLLGMKPEIPASATKDEIATGKYNAKPFSLASSVMTDEQTLQKYPVLPPVAPPGRAYFPGELANGLVPGQSEMLTIQFAAPPAPPPAEGKVSAKQTVTILLTGAEGPIARVPIPPLGAE